MPITMASSRCEPHFVPAGAKARWPFVIGTEQAYRRPHWSARPLLWWGLFEALLRIQPKQASDYWRALPEDYLGTFMHAGEVGAEHPSRLFAAGLVADGESVLDVGCGPGVNFEVLSSLGRASSYIGVDTAERAIEVARARYPTGHFRVGDADNLVHEFGDRSFDVVIVRHVLEHLPGFETVMEQAVEVSRRLAVFVFFLTPRALPFGARKVNLRFGAPEFLYVYSRSAIESLLAGLGVSFTWHGGIGTSRAGWFAGEVNSVLVVSCGERG